MSIHKGNTEFGDRINKLTIYKCQTRIQAPICKLVPEAKPLQTVPTVSAVPITANNTLVMDQCTLQTTNMAAPQNHQAAPTETTRVLANNTSCTDCRPFWLTAAQTLSPQTSDNSASHDDNNDTRVTKFIQQQQSKRKTPWLFAILSPNQNLLLSQLSPTQSKEHNNDNCHLNHSNHSLVYKNNNYSQQRITSNNNSEKTTTILSTSSLVTKRRSSKQTLHTILFLLSLLLYTIYQSITNHQTSASSFIELASANRIVIKPADRVVLTPGHELSLRCDVADYPQTQFRWYRVKQVAKNAEPQMDQPQEEELLPDDDRYVIHNNNIIIRSPTLNDVGDYYCRVWPADVTGIEKEKMVKVRVRPFIEDFKLATSTGRSAVLMEGERLVLFCNVMDDYSSNVDIQWFKSKFPDDETEMEEISNDGGRLKLESVNATSKSLTIDSVTKDDRSFYKCQAANGVTDNSKVIMIRVRDKLIALWPTIGIILELIILFGAIFIAENRKVEPDFDTSGRKIIQM